MAYKTLISATDLSNNLNNTNWVVVDCRFWNQDQNQAVSEYAQEHIPSAVYAHLDTDLSGPVIPKQTGRHPLPEVEVFAGTLSHWGIDEISQVVVYDEYGGAIAGRLWWMLNWLGHEAVAVLDGGYPAWKQGGHPIQTGEIKVKKRTFIPNANSGIVVNIDQLLAMRKSSANLIVDSRAEERYRGENETLDHTAGHIPGALNSFYQNNYDEDGLFLSESKLKVKFNSLINETSPDNTVFYCGSGVTANINILAMVHAGLGMPKLYPGSWSEWIADPKRPIATDNE